MNHWTREVAAGTSVACSYSRQPLTDILQTPGVLSVISFTQEAALGDDPRHIECGVPMLGQPPVHEVWYATGEVHSGYRGACSWSCSDDTLFVARCIDEAGDGRSQCELVDEAYTELLDAMGAQGFSNIVRVWNYLPEINAGTGDDECYRHFCIGRERALDRFGYQGATFPSASALGHTGQRTIVYLMASRGAVTHIENPKQVSAYDYPVEYGPASPSFARATLNECQASYSQLYVSGTASIVGHQSRYAGDLQGQLRTTFSNLEALLGRSAETAGVSSLQMGLLKIYVRRESDLDEIQQAVKHQYPGIPAVYLRADICRRELLVEIDGLSEVLEALPMSTTLHPAMHE
ncbi:MAG: hypothetical protein V7709_11010 [Halioglobus sp.]